MGHIIETREASWLRDQLRKASREIESWPQWMKNALTEERAALRVSRIRTHNKD